MLLKNAGRFTSPAFKREQSVDLKDIKAIIDLMRELHFGVRAGTSGFQNKTERGPNGGHVPVQSRNRRNRRSFVGFARAVGCGTRFASAQRRGGVGNQIAMIGTFYRAPSPDQRLMSRSSDVNPETVVCIIEAMKVMNEIKRRSRRAHSNPGRKRQTVEFGQPLLRFDRPDLPGPGRKRAASALGRSVLTTCHMFEKFW